MTPVWNTTFLPGMSNVLKEEKRQQVLALGRLGWSLRQIEEATGVRRETASGYLKAAGLKVRGRGRPPARPAKPAISPQMPTDSSPATAAGKGTAAAAPVPAQQPSRAPQASACEPYRELIVDALGRGRNAMAIWQDLVDDHGFPAGYTSVRRFVSTAHPRTDRLPRSDRPQNRRPLMNLVELDQALRKLRLSGMADVLETRLLHAQTEQMAPIDLLAALVSDELQRREDRLLARRHKQARFRDPDRALDGFDFAFNKKINRALVFELATARFVAQREDVLLIGQPGTGKSHLAQAIGRAAIQQGYRVLYRETHAFLEELAEATLAETRKDYLAELARAHLLIIDDLGMRKLPHTAAEDLLELIMRRYERASTMLTSNRPVDEWGKLLGDTAAVTALLDRLLHHAHVLKCGPRSWRTRVQTTLVESTGGA